MFFLTVLLAGSLRPSSRQNWFLVRALSLACRWPPSHRVPMTSLCVCTLLGSLLLIRKSVLLNLGSVLMTAFNINYFLRSPISKQSHWGLELQCMNLGGHISVPNSTTHFSIVTAALYNPTYSAQGSNFSTSWLTLVISFFFFF